VQAPEGAPRVDLTGKTVMPGIEAHAHLGYWKDLKPSAENFTRICGAGKSTARR
jgi:imidazolonepropionase-like amidohydrolase